MDGGAQSRNVLEAVAWEWRYGGGGGGRTAQQSIHYHTAHSYKCTLVVHMVAAWMHVHPHVVVAALLVILAVRARVCEYECVSV